MEIEEPMARKVSVVMCTYNGAKYVREQIESILGQTYPVAELIIQDDCSTDATAEILNGYEAKHPCVHAFFNEKRKGVNGNFFSAIARAAGDYIAISDQDDIWEPDKIEQQMGAIGDNLLCGCFSKPFSEDAGARFHYDDRKPNLSALRLVFDASLLAGHGVLFHKDLAKRPFSENSRLLYDFQLALFAAAEQKIAFCRKALVNYRVHTESVTYTEPLDYKKSLRNGMALAAKSFALRQQYKKNVKEYYGEIHGLLSKANGENAELRDVTRLCGLIARQDLPSLFKASLLCYKNRSKIFRINGEHGFFTAARALFQPMLMYHSFDKQRSSKRTKDV